jgi:hypothetical protein
MLVLLTKQEVLRLLQLIAHKIKQRQLQLKRKRLQLKQRQKALPPKKQLLKSQLLLILQKETELVQTAQT